MKLTAIAVAALSGAVLIAPPQQGSQTRTSARVPVSKARVVHVYPHDPEAFTQGLVYLDGFLYEGTGLNGRSSIRKVRLENGEVLQIQAIDSQYFGEGIVVKGDTIYELTWQSEIGFLYDRATFQRKGTFSYRGEGWGLTHDGQSLIMSDGTHRIRYLDPSTLQTTRTISVFDKGAPVDKLNELEYIDGEIYANIWQTDRIVRIEPKSGKILGWIDLTGLLQMQDRLGEEDVLNGIAYDAAGKRLFVTGKMWPKLFEIEIVRDKERS